MNRTMYIANKDGDELSNYGVKGLKLGNVRQEMRTNLCQNLNLAND